MIRYSTFPTVASTLLAISLGYNYGGKPVIDHLCTFQLHTRNSSVSLLWSFAHTHTLSPSQF